MSELTTTFYGAYKVMQRGERGQNLTLPNKWCKKHGIKPTDTLDVYIIEGEDYLIIKPQSKNKERIE